MESWVSAESDSPRTEYRARWTSVVFVEKRQTIILPKLSTAPFFPVNSVGSHHDCARQQPDQTLAGARRCPPRAPVLRYGRAEQGGRAGHHAGQGRLSV